MRSGVAFLAGRCGPGEELAFERKLVVAVERFDYHRHARAAREVRVGAGQFAAFAQAVHRDPEFGVAQLPDVIVAVRCDQMLAFGEGALQLRFEIGPLEREADRLEVIRHLGPLDQQGDALTDADAHRA